ncbi:MAG: AAA family ATPase [Patescibacteria group bacterium]
MIIGITGTLGAGKGSIVAYLKERGFVHYSGSAMLRKILEERGDEVNRDAYSRLAGEIRGEDPQGLAKLLWQQYESEDPEHAVIEALHDLGEADFVKEKGGQIIAVDADIDTRYHRVVARGSEKDKVTFDHFREQIQREEEGGGHHNIRAVINMADYVIMNNGTIEELHQEVERVLQEIEG